MAQCKDDLMIKPADCAASLVKVSADADVLRGFYRLSGKPPEGILADLFVDPNYIGMGLNEFQEFQI